MPRGHNPSPDADHQRARVVSAFRQLYGRRPAWLVRAPGRVNLLGAHVDYHEGWVLPGAIDRAVWLAAGPGEGTAMEIAALDLGESATLDRTALPPPVPERGDAAGWLDLPAGLAWCLAQEGSEAPPLKVAFGGDLPQGAGVSSSAAVEMAFLLAWEAAAGGLGLDGAGRAGLGRRTENAYLGVGTGIMDQFVCLHGRRDRLLLLDCRDLSYRLVPVPGEVEVLVMDSGVRRSLAGTGYSERQRECRQALGLLADRLPGVRTLRDVSPDELDSLAAELPPGPGLRARHVVEECPRALAGAEALERGDLAAFGELMAASHASSRDLYAVSTPELDLLAETAAAAAGCYGARLSGGGFGGCVTALVARGAAEEVAEAVRQAWRRGLGRELRLFTCRIGDGASLETLG